MREMEKLVREKERAGKKKGGWTETIIKKGKGTEEDSRGRMKKRGKGSKEVGGRRMEEQRGWKM